MIHLHLHSHYSVLDGLGKVPAIVAKAKALKAPAVAITDHTSLSCMTEFFDEAEKAGIKPILGCEFYLVDGLEKKKGRGRCHLTAWATDWEGVKSMMAQLTLANEQFYYRPLLTLEQAHGFRHCLIGTACCLGVLSHDNYRDIVKSMAETYEDALYLEIMPYLVKDTGTGEDLQKKANMRALELRADLGLKLVATCDAHYVEAEEAFTHRVLMAIQFGKTMKEMKEEENRFFMRSIKETAEAFKALGYIPPDALQEAFFSTVEIARRVDIRLPDFAFDLPSPVSKNLAV